MPDHTTGRRAGDGMVAGHVSGDTADDGTLDTALRHHGLGADEECNTEQWYGKQLQLRVDVPRHGVTLFPRTPAGGGSVHARL